MRAFYLGTNTYVATRSAATRKPLEPATMADSHDENTMELDAITATTDNDDTHSQDTVPSGRKQDNYDPEFVEIYLRQEITIKKKDERGPHLRHSAVLKAMYTSFPEDELQLINNRNKRIQPHNSKNWATSSYHQVCY